MSLKLNYVHTSVTVRFRFQSFTNPNRKGWDGSNCDWSLRGRHHCDHKFTFCFDYGNGSSLNFDECPLGKYETSEFDNSEVITFPVSWIDSVSSRRTYNPIRTDMRTWQNGVLLKVIVKDADGTTRDDLVDKYANIYDGAAFGQGVAVEDTYIRRLYRGMRDTEQTSLMVDISVQCNHDFYGKFCELHCPNMNQSHMSDNSSITHCSQIPDNMRKIGNEDLHVISKPSPNSNLGNLTMTVAVVSVVLLVILTSTIVMVVCIVHRRYKERQKKSRSNTAAILGNSLQSEREENINNIYLRENQQNVSNNYNQQTYGMPSSSRPGDTCPQFPNLNTREYKAQSNLYENRILPEIPLCEANTYLDMNGHLSKYFKGGLKEESIYCEMTDYEEPYPGKLKQVE